MAESAENEAARQRAPEAPADAGDGAGRPEAAAPEAPRTLPDAMERIGQLAADLAAANAELEQGRDRALRDRAELENFKRRMQRDKSEALRFANEGLLRDLLPVIDNLQRAVQAARNAQGSQRHGAAGSPAALLEGVEMVLNQFADVLARFGVTRVPAVGEPFDPAQHEALAQVETIAHPPGTVVEEHLPGYRLHDRLLRAAQVSVARPPSGDQPGPRQANGAARSR
jgi:molecular chaperone GrpE